MFFYDRLSCPVCKKPFTEGDDVVACPQCGLPHHRACWASEGKCHEFDKHGTPEQWSREKAQTEDTVKNLQYNMPRDFARRVAQQKIPTGVSKEVYTCMQYISTHINEPIHTDDVIAVSGKSRSYLFKKFRQELGVNIGAYIMQCRLRECCGRRCLHQFGEGRWSRH